MKFYIVDAFTDTLLSGNPAGVVILDHGTDFPSETIMRKTAAELRYSETAFIRQTGEKEFQFRCFTPTAEVDLCGHATIGSFFALADARLVSSAGSYICDTLAGVLNIQLSGSYVFMDMGEPKDLGKITDFDALQELYGALGLRYADQSGIDDQYEIYGQGGIGRQGGVEIISTGLPDIILPVRDETQLTAISPDFDALSRLSEKYDVVGIHAFTVKTADGRIHCRNFAPLYGINEEAATGTSNGALTYYFYKHGLMGRGSEILFIQGEAMGRPSKILSRIVDDVDLKIQIGGSAAILASGEIYI